MGTYEGTASPTKAKYPGGAPRRKLALPRRRVQRMPGNREDTLDETSTPKEVEVLIENWLALASKQASQGRGRAREGEG